MAQQNSFLNFSLPDASMPRNLASNSFPVSQNSRPEAGADMLRHLSNDSGFCSITSQLSDEAYSPGQAYPNMPYNAASPGEFEENYTFQQYASPPVLRSSPAMERSNSARSYASRATPSSLGLQNDAPLQAYKFVVMKGKEPFFELPPTAYAGPDAPTRIYLDTPMYVLVFSSRKALLITLEAINQRTHFPANTPDVCLVSKTNFSSDQPTSRDITAMCMDQTS
jgi:hypothetical protein